MKMKRAIIHFLISPIFQSPEHYQTNYPGYPGYAGYEGGGGHHAGYYSGYPSKQSGGGYSDQYPMSGYPAGDNKYQYYPSCQQPPADPSTANTPLPPDFSYVGSGGAHPHGQENTSGAGYNDFYAMG